MKVIGKTAELQKVIRELDMHPAGFVPTMGALHEGHLSLVRNAVNNCPLTIVSIYVNPTQFNDKNDLKKYPRTLETDLGLLKDVLRENDLVFTPDDREIYPEPDTRIFHFGNLDKVMEAAQRPGHFNGVAQVVSRLFDIVMPDIAYFGIKDFQQVAVIKELVKQKKYNIRIIGNPIIREKDGLAMSSRNTLLEKSIRKKAPVIFRTITSAANMSDSKDIPELKNFIKSEIEKEEEFKLEYFEVVDELELKPISSSKEKIKGMKYYGCIAVKAGKIRLIDNIEFPLV